MMKSSNLFCFFIGLLMMQTSVQLLAQSTPEVMLITSGTKTSLRGLSVVNDNVIWVSGSNGTVGKSLNGGKNWNWMTVKGFEKKEFRDIEGFDGNTAIIMAIDSPAYILKTTDGGDTWKVVYENRAKGMFLDAMDFCDFANGMVVGDPIDKKVFLAYTTDNGNTWKEFPDDKKPLADSGEAFFAASGSNIRLYRDGSYFLASGGTASRLIKKPASVVLPLIQGKETTGANSIDMYDNGNPAKPGKRIIIVGGDFNRPASTEKNCFYTNDGGKTWKAPKVAPHGYRSSVEYLSQKDIVACGINGVDYSSDGGKTWKWISNESFHVARIARNGSALFLAGENGKIAKLNFEH
ncbi:MAG: oxidoreductase [Chitinophagaceae bacterium]|nr:oxidoreductase [Chitinophagaceae bacterium]